MEKNNINSGSFSTEDSDKIEKMSIKDSLFIDYLNNHIKDSLIFTVQGKCARIIDSAFINSRFNNLIKERENSFLSYFRKRKAENRVTILKNEMVIPYNGFSFYKIEYKGEFPVDLIKAYQKMNELNSEAPRKKFSRERMSINKKSSEQ